MSVSIIKMNNVSEYRGISTTTYKSVVKQKSVLDDTSFLAEALYKEVINQDRSSGKNRKLKSLKKLHRGFMSILVTAMMASPATAFAQSGNAYPVMTPVSNEQEITPDLVMEWGFTIALITVAIGVALAGSLLAIAGIYKMFRKGKEAEDWTTDIIKGFVQVLIAIPVVYSLFYLAQMVFKRLPFLDGLM